MPLFQSSFCTATSHPTQWRVPCRARPTKVEIRRCVALPLCFPHALPVFSRADRFFFPVRPRHTIPLSSLLSAPLTCALLPAPARFTTCWCGLTSTVFKDEQHIKTGKKHHQRTQKDCFPTYSALRLDHVLSALPTSRTALSFFLSAHPRHSSSMTAARRAPGRCTSPMWRATPLCLEGARGRRHRALSSLPSPPFPRFSVV